MSTFDVVICGGAAIGSSTAYHLAANPDFTGSVAVVERDPTYANCSTARSAGAIRQQFSTPENIRMSLFGRRFIADIGTRLAVADVAPDIGFKPNPFLFLADAKGLEVLRHNLEIQLAEGAQVALLGPPELQARFPWLNVDDLAGGALGLANEGWMDPYALLMALRAKAIDLGVRYLRDTVTGLDRDGDRITAVALAGGDRLACGHCVNAAGPGAGRLAALAGVDLPVEPRKRIVNVFDCRQRIENCPLLIDPTGVYCRPEGRQYLTGIAPAEADDPPCDDFEIDYHWFEEICWPTLAHRIPAFAAIKQTGAWAGHYDHNRLDQNAIIGRHPEVANFYFGNGHSGHGLQHSPAVGNALTELITYGEYRAIDLTRFGYERILTGTPIKEVNVV